MSLIQLSFITLRKIYFIIFGRKKLPEIKRELDPNQVSEAISNLLKKDSPCMIARFGAFELETIVNYLDIQESKKNPFLFIIGKEKKWWWNNRTLSYLQSNAGFFPATKENAAKFSKLMLDDFHQLDILSSWNKEEFRLGDFWEKLPKIGLLAFEPWWAQKPWSYSLKDKTVLVIHPFSETIEKQYKTKGPCIFRNPDVLPPFKKLVTIKAIQSIGGSQEFNSWFEALDYMKNMMDQIDYDIALIGCGAYGFSLAAHAKRTGHQAIHMGGALQLLFGIKGKRWENPAYGDSKFNYQELFSEHWVYPNESDRPQNFEKVENGCYW